MGYDISTIGFYQKAFEKFDAIVLFGYRIGYQPMCFSLNLVGTLSTILDKGSANVLTTAPSGGVVTVNLLFKLFGIGKLKDVVQLIAAFLAFFVKRQILNKKIGDLKNEKL